MNRSVVLVVDDHPGMRKALRVAIEISIGAHVIEAEDGEAALAIVTTMRPSLILLDLLLPKLNGLAVAGIIKANPDTRSIPVIAISAHSNREEALEAGCDDYLAKPFGLDELLDKMTTYLRDQTNGTDGLAFA